MAAAIREVLVSRWENGRKSSVGDVVADEMPVAITFHGVAYAVMLATPADLVDFGYGFTLTESLVAIPSEIRDVSVVRHEERCDLDVTVTPERFAALLQRRRNMAGRSGCGLCGVEAIEQAMRVPAQVGNGVMISAAELHRCLTALHRAQPLNSRAGSVHAAAWCLPDQGVMEVREDIGRHNALDKVIGALVQKSRSAAAGYLLISSRASYEMVLKSAVVGVSLLVAISAPTALAIRLAEQCGMTLVGFARDDSHVVYTHPHRVG
jgi:FdhD protein